MASPVRKLTKKVGKKVTRLASKAVKGLTMEASILRTLHQEVHEALARIYAADPGFKQLVKDAHAYVVFPSVGKAAAVVGGTFGKGEVFEDESLVGYSAIAQLTLGVQLGGQTFTEVIVFENEESLGRFKQGKFKFAANASAVLVKAGAAATTNFEAGAKTFVFTEGGMTLEAAIGAQKFFFFPAVMGRGQEPEEKRGERRRTKGGSATRKDDPSEGRSKSSGKQKRTKR
jgi:hypothetical protein